MIYSHRARTRLLLIGLLWLAFALRVVNLSSTPPGLSHDEAYNGIAAMQVLEGQQRPIFFEINKGIEPLIIYLEALAFYLFGIGPVPLRLVNVICGLLTVALVYPLAVRLFGRRVALLATAGLAISFWAIFVSRLTLRAVTLPPLLILTIYCLWRGLAHRERLHTLKWFVLGGLAAGATMYTYLSGRFLPFLIAAIFGYQLLRGQVKQRHWLGLLALALVWAALFFPLARYYLDHPDSFARRADQVLTLPYALNGDFGPLLENSLATLGMFTFRGDETDRYNLAGRPVFDWANGLLFYLGLGLLALRLGRRARLAGPAALLLLWLFFMLLSDLITSESPHFLRTIGVLAAVYIIWALGLGAAWDWADRRLAPRAAVTGPALLPFRSYFAPALVGLLFLLTTLHTGYDYFWRWAASPEARYIYGADIAEVAGYVKRRPEGDLLAISAEYYRDLDPFRFQLHFGGQPPFAIWFDGRQSLAFPPPGSGLSPRYLFPASAPPAAAWLPFLEPVPAESGREYTLYRLAGGSQQPVSSDSTPDSPLGIHVNDDLVLSAYRLLGPLVTGGRLQLVLAWQALRSLPPGSDYTFLLRLRDSQGHIWAEADGNGYDPVYWQPGVLGRQLLTLRLPGDLPLRVYHLTLEVVDRNSGRSLPDTTGETVFTLGQLPAQLAASPRIMDVGRLPNPVAAGEPARAYPAGGPPVALRGYQLHNPFLRPGETLSLSLHWQVLARPGQDYRLLFFLAPNDGPDAAAAPVYAWPPLEPVGGEWPTGGWPAGYWVQDRLELPIEPDVPPGDFKLWLAWEAGPAAPVESGAAASLGMIHVEP